MDENIDICSKRKLNSMSIIKRHSIKYVFLMNFFLSASQFIFPLITFPYISRVLLAEGIGKVSFSSSVANYFMIVASLGIPTYGIRACAQVRDDRRKLSKTVQEILILNAITTALVTATYIFLIFTVSKFKADKTLFLINGLSILLNMFGMNWLFQALEQYEYITIRSLAFKIISVLAMFAFVRKESDYVFYGGITVFASVGSNILNVVRAKRYVNLKWMGDYHLRRHMKPIMILFAQSLAVSVYTNLDTVMLGFMKADVDVGYYNVAVKIKTILVSLVTSLGNVLLPRMAYYAKERNKEAFMNTMQKALNFTTLLSVPLAIYFCMYSSDSIRFLAGDGYADAVLAMQIIIIAIIPIGITSILGVQVLTAIEKEKYVLLSVTIGALSDFALNCVFISSMGAAGAALATTISEFIVLIVQVIYTKQLLCDISHELHFHTYILLVIPSIAFAYMVKIFEFESSFIRLLISAIIFFGIYGIELLLAKDSLVMNAFDSLKKKLKKNG